MEQTNGQTPQSLIDFIATVSGEDQLRVEENLGEGFVRLRVSEAERRQAKHDIRQVEDIVIEMLRNARDAQATRIYVATIKHDDTRELYLIDDGAGVPEGLHQRIFEPRVTSKLQTMTMDEWGVHGRGMALYSIKQNCDEAKLVNSYPGLGSSFKVIASLGSLTEKADQSTWPDLSREKSGKLSCTRGPHNIARRVIEFSIAHPHIQVYLGSPTEIVACLYQQSQHAAIEVVAQKSSTTQLLPLCERLALAQDAQSLMQQAYELFGIELSERSAHRILSGSIKQLEPALTWLCNEKLKDLAPEALLDQKPKAVDLLKDRRGLRLHASDLQSFSRQLEACFEELAEKYYLSPIDAPKISVSKDAIVVKFPFEKEE